MPVQHLDCERAPAMLSFWVLDGESFRQDIARDVHVDGTVENDRHRLR